MIVLNICIYSGADGRNQNFSSWVSLEEHACAVGSLRLHIASEKVNKRWVSEEKRLKPCFLFLQSSMGIAVRNDILRLRQNFLELNSSESISSLEVDDTPAFVRFFTIKNNVYPGTVDNQQNTSWGYVAHDTLIPFHIPQDFVKVGEIERCGKCVFFAQVVSWND